MGGVRGGKSQWLVPSDRITFNGDFEQLIFKIKTQTSSQSDVHVVFLTSVIGSPRPSSPSSEAGALEGVLGALQ